MKKLLLILSLSTPLYGADVYQSIGPFGGLNNTDSPIVIPANKSPDLLNVDVSPGGASVKKREGYGLSQTLTIATSPVHGVYTFFDSAGNAVDLYFNDKWISASVGGATAVVLSSTGSLNATWQCVDSQGFAYCESSARTSLLKTNGVTFSYINTVNSTGTMVAVTPERLVTSGFSEAPNRVDFSKANDFSNWVIGSAGTDAAQFTVVSPGSRITHIVYAFGRIMWFKDSSFGFIFIGQEDAQADWQVKTVSPNVGTLDNTSIYWEGILYFRGQDGHIWSYDGSVLEKMTRDLQGTISISGNRTTSSWVQTSQADFQASSITPSGYVSTTIESNSLVLGTATAISDFTDDTEANFVAGIVQNTTATVNSGSIILSTTSATHETPYGDSTEGDQDICTGSNDPYTVFLTTSNYVLTSMVAKLKIGLGTPGSIIQFKLRAADGASSAPGTTLMTGTASIAGLSGSYADISIDLTDFPLTNGTSYWMGLNQADIGECDGSNELDWARDESFPAGWVYTSAITAGRTLSSKYIGYQYSTSGNFVSRAFDNGFSTSTWLWDWATFYASGTVPSGGSISYETQTSSDSACSTCWDSLVSLSSGSSPTSTVRRYIRYKASFTTTNQSTSPILNYVEQNLSSRLRPGGTFYSDVHNITGAISSWDTFSANKQDNGGSQNFSIRAASGVFSLNSSTPAWTSVTSGAIPSISTGAYVQVRELFSVTKATQSPKTDDITVSWFEGQASDKAYASYHKDALWWSISSGVSVSTNNRILRYDLINQDWYLYDIGTNGMLVRSNTLYFGSSSAGKIFKFGDTDSDDGSAINATWKSKDFVQGDPFVKKDYKTLSVSAGSVQNSSMTVTYTVNGSSSTSYLFALNTANNSYRHFNKNLPLGTQGNTFSVRFGNSLVDAPFEVFAIKFSFTDQAWTPTQ